MLIKEENGVRLHITKKNVEIPQGLKQITLTREYLEKDKVVSTSDFEMFLTHDEIFLLIKGLK